MNNPAIITSTRADSHMPERINGIAAKKATNPRSVPYNAPRGCFFKIRLCNSLIFIAASFEVLKDCHFQILLFGFLAIQGFNVAAAAFMLFFFKHFPLCFLLSLFFLNPISFIHKVIQITFVTHFSCIYYLLLLLKIHMY